MAKARAGKGHGGGTLSQEQVREFALMGARARLESLRAETAALLAAFPELARGDRRRAAAAPAGSDTEAPGAPRKRARRRRYTMTPEQKQAVSERMKKYWAARRKEKARGN
jgi:hypothetical protein